MLRNIGFDFSSKIEHDDEDIPKIFYEEDDSFRICYKFYCPFKYHTQKDIEKEKELYLKELDDYFP